MELVLLLIVGVCAIALIYINLKSKALEKDGIAAVSGASKTDTSTDGEQETEDVFDSLQNTIYRFRSGTGKCSCPFCDGENSVGVPKCNICGKDI